jgi:hypothetical protein
MCYNKMYLYAQYPDAAKGQRPIEMKGVFQSMRIYHPVRGVGGALREDSFAIIDDAGVEIGRGGLEYKVV